jgi:hypothetical protein
MRPMTLAGMALASALFARPHPRKRIEDHGACRARRRLGPDRAFDAAGVGRGKLVRSAQVTNVAGAGGSVGIAQFVTGAKGDGNQIMVNGFVMVGALLMNKSPVTLDQ